MPMFRISSAWLRSVRPMRTSGAARESDQRQRIELLGDLRAGLDRENFLLQAGVAQHVDHRRERRVDVGGERRIAGLRGAQLLRRPRPPRRAAAPIGCAAGVGVASSAGGGVGRRSASNRNISAPEQIDAADASRGDQRAPLGFR